jgi:predicted secreted Zn-dependent protease
MKRAIALVLFVAACIHTEPPDLRLGATPEGVVIATQVTYYDMPAETVGELRRAMVMRGPMSGGRGWSAVTQSTYRWTFESERSPSRCAVRQPRVQLKVAMTFPRWSPTGEPDPETVLWWERFQTGLMEHERGHALISVRWADEIVRELSGLTSSTCDSLGILAGARGSALVSRSRAQQVEYDRATNHGATQIERAGRLRTP